MVWHSTASCGPAIWLHWPGLPLVVLYVSRGWVEGGRAMPRRNRGGCHADVKRRAGNRAGYVASTVHIMACGTKGPLFQTLRSSSGLPLVCWSSVWPLVQLLPFMELTTHSDRTASGGTAAWSMPADGLANFLVPLFHCSKTILGPYIQVNQQWTSSY